VNSIVVLTGAGISAESGIATFRASDGLWENHRIEDVATPEGFARNPQLVHHFYNQRRRQPSPQPQSQRASQPPHRRARNQHQPHHKSHQQPSPDRLRKPANREQRALSNCFSFVISAQRCGKNALPAQRLSVDGCPDAEGWLANAG